MMWPFRSSKQANPRGETGFSWVSKMKNELVLEVLEI
uniref:Uncharacterized protein n=1 Tax=Setaria italica TaxID=4555 RepID=K3YNJ4_SETIT